EPNGENVTSTTHALATTAPSATAANRIFMNPPSTERLRPAKPSIEPRTKPRTLDRRHPVTRPDGSGKLGTRRPSPRDPVSSHRTTAVTCPFIFIPGRYTPRRSRPRSISRRLAGGQTRGEGSPERLAARASPRPVDTEKTLLSFGF